MNIRHLLRDTLSICFNFRVILSLKDYMKTGIPEAGVAPLDPLKLDNVGFNLAGASIDFMNITLDGMSDHQLGEVTYDESSRFASTF